MDIKENLLKEIEDRILKLKDQEDTSFETILKELKEREQKRKEVPVSIFDNDSLSCLEAMTKYLKEDMGLDYKQISSLLYRNYDPIAITYRRSKKKHPSSLKTDSQYNIPLNIFRKTNLSVLENITSYMKDSLGLTFHEIAQILKRDDRTIWTVYQRASKKKT